MTLSGPEGDSPPLPYIEVEDREARALLSLYPKSIQVVSEDEAAAEWAAAALNDPPVPEPEMEPEPEPKGETPPPVGETDAPNVSEGTTGPEASEDGQAGEPPAEVAFDETISAGEREVEIGDAIDLLEAGDFVKTGARKGRPLIGKVEGILGYDVTVEEVDAVFAKREAA